MRNSGSQIAAATTAAHASAAATSSAGQRRRAVCGGSLSPLSILRLCSSLALSPAIHAPDEVQPRQWAEFGLSDRELKQHRDTTAKFARVPGNHSRSRGIRRALAERLSTAFAMALRALHAIARPL